MRSIILQDNKLVKTVAIATAFSLLLWTVGLQSARGAGVTDFSITLSDSAPSAEASHAVAYTSATAAAAAETIVFSYSDNWDFSALDGSVAAADFSGVTGLTIVDTCDTGGDEVTVTASNTGGSKGLTFTVCAGDTVPAGTITFTIGDGAAGGALDIINPAPTGSEEIDLGGTQTDSGSTRVFIIENISMTATVDTIFNFWINGRTTAELTANNEADGQDGTNNDITTTATEIPWGEITQTAGVTGYAASHTLSVGTNASNGFVVTLEQDQDLTSSATDTIDLFADGAETATPVAWAAPSGTLGNVNEYGHWGITSEDDINGDEFVSGGTPLYAGNLATPREVFSHTGPADGQSNGSGTADIGATNVGYKLQITALQEAGDYQNTLTYIATPTF